MAEESSTLLHTLSDESKLDKGVLDSRSAVCRRAALSSSVALLAAAILCKCLGLWQIAPTTSASQATIERASEEDCSWIKTNCTATKCCREAGMQCYQQSPTWAQCMPACQPGPIPTHWDGVAWTCKELGSRASGDPPKCSEPGQDCSESRCCSDSGLQCYEKQKGWATCKVSCTKGVDLTDSNSDPWNCDKLGDRADLAAPWVAEQCTASGEDCRKTKCCAVEGEQCFARDDFWAQCMPSCTPGPNPDEPWNDKKWSCKELGSRTPAKPVDASQAFPLAEWVSSYCAKDGENCKKSQCCQDPGMQCYEKDDKVSKCKASCAQGPDLFDVDEKPWSCHAVGPRTPGESPLVLGAKVSSWVDQKCAKGADGCLDIGCCAEVGQQCFAKNEGWATCLGDCVAGENRSIYGDIDDKPWSCKELGPRTPRPWGSPSLYCISVVRTDGYEPDLMRAQIAKGAGIFSCDDYDVFSNEPYAGRGNTFWHPDDEVEVETPLIPINMGIGPLGPLETIPFKPTYVGQSMDSTAGNTELFLRVWHLVRDRGHYAHADWVLKVDPDAVLIADRMRKVLKPYTGTKTYIVNCDKPGMAPMMFGSVEMLAKEAMQEFFERENECTDGLDWKVWGEDYFLGKCFDVLGVTRTNQFSAVQDGVCKGVDCSNADAGAFHPMKDTESWMSCWEQAKWQ